MNCKKLQKGSLKDMIDVESSLTNSSVESICQRNSDADEGEEDIGISHFLDLMKVSCSINDVISVQTTQKVVGTGNIPASNTLKDDSYFEKVIDNQLLNDVLVSGRKNEVLGSNIVEVSGTSISGHANYINFNSRRNTRTDGWTIDAISSRDKNIDSRLVRSESAQSKLCKKLDYVINEGMVDSVLSFICPIPVSAAFPNFKSKHKREPLNRKPMTSDNLNSQLLTGCARIVDMECDISTNQTNDIIPEDAKSVRKLTTIRADKKEPEVIIHVCDEVKNTTKDFHCPQKLLVGKMGYFAEITAGQKLDEMDISVHCDIQIFDWLIKWMKLTDLAGSPSRRNSTFKDAESAPHLDANNVIPILVSAGFLQVR